MTKSGKGRDQGNSLSVSREIREPLGYQRDVDSAVVFEHQRKRHAKEVNYNRACGATASILNRCNVCFTHMILSVLCNCAHLWRRKWNKLKLASVDHISEVTAVEELPLLLDFSRRTSNKIFQENMIVIDSSWKIKMLIWSNDFQNYIILN